MMRREITGMVAVGMFLGFGCSKPPAPEDPAAVDEGRDYSQVLRNVRERSSQNMNLDRLRGAITSFEAELGRSPTNLAEVVRYGFIEEIPPAPAGMVFSYDPTSSFLDMIPAAD